jgi:1,4-alpha-glucan branching enzyme
MIKRQSTKDSKVKVTFALPAEDAAVPVYVLGEFNNWDPSKGKLAKRANGTFSTTVTLDGGKSYQFRYYSADGKWFNDQEADGYVPTEVGSQNCVLHL